MMEGYDGVYRDAYPGWGPHYPPGTPTCGRVWGGVIPWGFRGIFIGRMCGIK